MLDALDRAGVNPLGQKGVSAQTFERALSVAQDALTSRSRSATAGAASAPGPRDIGHFVQPTAADLATIARGGIPSYISDIALGQAYGRYTPSSQPASGAAAAYTPTRTSGLPYVGTAPFRATTSASAPRSGLPYPGSGGTKRTA